MGIRDRPKTGDALKEGKALMARGSVDLAMLDARIEELCAKILLTFPDCTTKTLEELRKPKLEAWNRNKEDARAWLAPVSYHHLTLPTSDIG